MALGITVGEALPVGATVQVNPPQASCYDFYYWDALSSFYESTPCNQATISTGYYGSAAFDYSDGQTAFTRGSKDAVFFSAGHSLDFCTGSDCSGVAFLFQSSSGILDALVGDASYTADLGGPSLSRVCDDSGNCHTQSSTAGKAYSWGTAAELDEINLVVLQGCVTANNDQGTSMAEAAYDAGAGTTIGFTQNISFPAGSVNTNAYGYAWGNRFWNDLKGGSSYSGSMVDASNYENSVSGGWFGYNSYYMYQYPGAPNSLRPAQYFYLVGCYSCI